MQNIFYKIWWRRERLKKLPNQGLPNRTGDPSFASTYCLDEDFYKDSKLCFTSYFNPKVVK